MNSIDINLLVSRGKGIEQQEQIVKYFRFAAGGSLGLITLLAIIVFILRLLSPIPALEKEKDSLASDIDKLNVKLGTALFISDRTHNIAKIMEGRKNFDDLITQIQSKMPPGVTIQTVNVDQATLSMTITGRSFADADSFINNLVNLGKYKKIFSKIVISDLETDTSANGFLMKLDTALL